MTKRQRAISWGLVSVVGTLKRVRLTKILVIRQGSHPSLARQAVLDHGGARQLGELAGIRELEIILPWGWASLRGLFPFGD